ncbi:retrotransposon protein [Cucumis melo var. makuwa]|uniref:Retrotransposon protein n=1 Tax=Cucumis melo var. makuwa TaxID=1194695 RepID=A0A5A7VKA9_CUCMM|nr:retrotransposon protein [Cucumis melo var. makuwa]
MDALMNDNKRFSQTPYDTRHRIRQLAYFRKIHETVVGLSLTEVVNVEEMVAMFFHVLAHYMKNHIIHQEFVRSGETVSRHFNLILLALLGLHDELIKKPVPVTNNCTDQRWKCFENCLGTLDGMYIKVNMPQQIALRYAAESQVLRDALVRKTDSKYQRGFLAPYRGQRYHLKEWRDAGNVLTTTKEYFNMKHSSARNVIECAFGALKGHWAILHGKSTTSRFVETFVDVRSNEPVEYEGFDMPNGNEEFPSMYNQGIDMSQKDVRTSRTSRVSEGRAKSSRLKRKRGSQREGKIEVIHMALECMNDQFRTIAEWHARALTNDSHVR